MEQRYSLYEAKPNLGKNCMIGFYSIENQVLWSLSMEELVEDWFAGVLREPYQGLKLSEL